MEPENVESYSYYNFEIKQYDPDIKESFCITYNNIEIFVYDGKIPVHEIKKEQIKYKLDYNLPMDFLRFSNDYFCFRMEMSLKFLALRPDNDGKGIFFYFPAFDEFRSQMNTLIIHGVNELKNNLILNDCSITGDVPPLIFGHLVEDNDNSDIIHQITRSLIEELYVRQRNYSSNLVLNSKIHIVVMYYPDFSLYYDIMKIKLELFNEDNDYLTFNSNKINKEDIAQYFGNLRTPAEWVPIETLFNVRNMKQSCHNINEKTPEKKTIKKMIKEYYDTLPESKLD